MRPLFRVRERLRDRVLAPLAAQNDKAGRFSTEAVDALGRRGSARVDAAGRGRRLWSGTTDFRGRHRNTCRSRRIGRDGLSYARARRCDHCRGAVRGGRCADAAGDCGRQGTCPRSLSARPARAATFGRPISRARRNGSGVRITASKSWVTSAGHAQSYVVSSLAPEGSGPTDSDSLSRSGGCTWPVGCGPLGWPRPARERFRTDDSRRLRGAVRASDHRRWRWVSRR